MRRRKKNWILIPFIGVVFLILGCSRDGDSRSGASWNPPDDEMRTVAVEGVRAELGSLVDTVRSAGIAEGVREAWIISEADGIVRESLFQLGDSVDEGETLIVLDGELASRNRDLAQGQYNTALLEFQAAERSLNNGSISALQYSQISDRLLAAEASLAAANEAFENTIIRAPFAGAVAAAGADLGIGNYVSRSSRIARIVDNRSFRTEVSVGEGQILLVEKGAKATISGNDGIRRPGEVLAVSAGSDGSTGAFAVVVGWTPLDGDRLKSGMSVDVFIETAEEGQRIIVPASAIRIRAGEEYLFVDEDGTASARLIETGNRLGDRVEVLSGVSAGEVVITSGLASLTPGSPVAATLIDGGDL